VVTDPSGAAIAGLAITATEKGTGFKRSATTDTSGSYRFSLLPPGDYQLQFVATGFKTALPPVVTIAVTEVSTLNVQMVIGEAVDTVEVTTSAQLVASRERGAGHGRG